MKYHGNVRWELLLHVDTRTGKDENVTSLYSQLLRECVEKGYN